MLKCHLCNKSFSRKSTLDYHMVNNVCKKPDNKVCPKCQKHFSTKQMCQYHISHNVCAHLSDQPSKQKPQLILKNKYDNYTKDELRLKVAQLEGQVTALTEHPQTVNNNNIIVFPKEFGKEDMNYIQQKLGDIMGPLIKNHTFSSIPTLFNKIHNNQKIPEYHNVYSTSERSNFALISDGHTFNHRPKKNVIDQIIESKRSMLNDYVDANGEQLGESVLKKYERYQDRIDDDSEFRKNLELEISGMLLDMKEVIATDEKTRKLLEKVDEGHLELVES